MKRLEERKKKGSELFKTLVITSEKYLRDYTDGRQQDDEKAKLALRVLSVYRRMLKIEKERKVLRLEWERLKKAVAAWKGSSEGNPERPHKNRRAHKTTGRRQ
jgi:CRISPR/Cas system-associated endonuclease Cas3-HD